MNKDFQENVSINIKPIEDMEASFLSVDDTTKYSIYDHYDKISEYAPRIVNINITSTFTGIGYILLDLNSVVYTAIQQHNLDKRDIPSHTISEHLKYITENLRCHSLKYIHCFYEYVNDPWIDLIINVIINDSKNNINFINYSDFKESMEDVRIALVISCYNRTSLNEFFNKKGMYVGILDTLMFVSPFVHCNVIKPYNKIYEEDYDKFIKYNSLLVQEGISYYSVVDDYKCPDIFAMLSLNEYSLKELNDKFNETRFVYKYDFLDFKIQNPFDILKYNLLSTSEKILFDGRIFHNKRKIIENANISIDNRLFELKDNFPWKGKDLDLIMSPLIEKMSMKHLANIQRSAKSMHDGKFQYSTIIKES